jgi:serine/threonine-protein kinase ULK/ATG1
MVDEPVSIKVIHKTVLKDNKLDLLIKNEIRLLSKMMHHNVLRLESVVDTDEDICLVTEYCDEGDLEVLIKKLTRLDENTATRFLKDVIDGYKHLAQADIIHRDLKPSNIFIHKGRAKIADFGFAITSKYAYILNTEILKLRSSTLVLRYTCQ